MVRWHERTGQLARAQQRTSGRLLHKKEMFGDIDTFTTISIASLRTHDARFITSLQPSGRIFLASLLGAVEYCDRQ